MRTLLAGIALLLLATPTQAFNGASLRKLCLSSNPEYVAMCTGWATGVGQTLIMANRWTGETMPSSFCAPDDYQPEETGALILEYLDAHPDHEQMDLAVVGLAALSDRFPCL